MTLLKILNQKLLLLEVMKFELTHIFYFLTKKKIDNISYERQINEEKKIKTIQDTFGSIRDLIILGCRNFSYDYFSAKTKSVSSSKRKIEFLNFLPNQ